MAKFLAQSPIVPALLTSRSHGPSKKRSVKMMCNLQTHGLRIRSFSGLRGSNSLDDMKVIKVIMSAQEEARWLCHNFVGTEQISLGLIGKGTDIAAKVLKSMGINLKDARVEMYKIIGRGTGFVDVEILFTPRAKRVPELSAQCVVQILGRRKKNNPCLIREPGVGKTTITEGLAQHIAIGDITDIIEGKKVVTLHTCLLVSGTKYREEFEERLKKLMEEIKQKGAIDATNILKPALARGELQKVKHIVISVGKAAKKTMLKDSK
ncbi:hypothetical protein GQ457_04G017230 [Hibiscus cannabinus]